MITMGMSTLGYALPDKETEFIQHYLPQTAQKQHVWLNGAKKQTAIDILGHRYHKARAAYWQPKSAAESKSAKTVWILEEIGKEKYITIGVVIEKQRIQAVRIIEFRESRGWEVKLPSFTAQFDQAELTSEPGTRLNKHINGISGATLSVKAVTKIARLALYLQSTLPNP